MTSPMLAPDPGVPHRDALLDATRLTARLDGLLGVRGPAGIRSVEHLRIKYRVGRGVGLVLRVHTGRRAFLVSARSFAPGAGAGNHERALAAAPRAVIGLAPVSYAPELETVFWAFPNDRRIAALELLCGPGEELAALAGEECVPALAAYVPEKAATARCLNAHGTAVAYVKVYAAGAARSHALLRALATGLAGTGAVRIPRPLGYDEARQAVAIEPIPGGPIAGEPVSGAPSAGLFGLGAALAALHELDPPRGLAPLERLDPDGPARAAELLGAVRPDLARAAAELADALGAAAERATTTDQRPPVCLHGDPHPKNALADRGAIALIDLDQAGRGPAAADLGSVLAGLRYRRLTGALSSSAERSLADGLRAGYASVRALPGEPAMAWHTAASLLSERALGAVTRVRPAGLGRLDAVIDAGREALPQRAGRPLRIASKPRLLLYCQHAVGLGHLTRSSALAGALSSRFEVVLLSGGAIPRRFAAPRGVEVVPLPPLILREGGGLLSPDRRRTVERAQLLRGRMIADALRVTRPAVVLVELFPFGRRAFTGEIVAMLDQARAQPGGPPLIVSSVRDILVGRGEDQPAYDERAGRLANAHFDAILVHADPRFARLEESFRPRTPLRVPVHHTGFVSAAPAAALAAVATTERRSRRVLVSAGGGRVGEPLFQAAIDAQPLLAREHGMSMRVIAGPFLSEPACQRLRAQARGIRGLVVRRAVPDLSAELHQAAASVSQCGYNTALEVLRARVPALVVPYSAPGEDEQMRRAGRLARLGAVRMLDPRSLSGPQLAAQIAGLASDPPAPVDLDLDGATTSTELLWRMLEDRAGVPTKAAIA